MKVSSRERRMLAGCKSPDASKNLRLSAAKKQREPTLVQSQQVMMQD